MTQALRIVLDKSMMPAERIEKMLQEVEEERLLEALTLCDGLETRDDIYVRELLGRHSHLKQYLPRFLALPFRGEPGTEALLAALDIARQLHAGTIEALPDGVPTQFVAGALGGALMTGGKVNVRIWELGLAFAVREALRSGNLYIAESHHYISFWKLIHGEDTWAQRRARAYADLQVAQEPDHALDALRVEFDQVARFFVDGLASNRFASVRDGVLALKKRETNPEPSGVREIRDVIEAHLPRVRIENLLMEVDSWCGFTRELTPLGGYRPRTENLYPALLASVVAHGTDLGLSAMSLCADGLTVDMLHHVSRWYLRTDTLRAANRALDQLVRVASSLKDRTTPAHVVLDRLAAGSPSDRLAKALTMLGRVLKTIYVLQYMHDGALRDRVHLQLNRGEHRHALTDRSFFGNQGEFRTGNREE